MEALGDVIRLSTRQSAKDALDIVRVDEKTDNLLVIDLDCRKGISKRCRPSNKHRAYIQLGEYCWMHMPVIAIGEVEKFTCVLDNSWRILCLPTIAIESTIQERGFVSCGYMGVSALKPLTFRSLYIVGRC